MVACTIENAKPSENQYLIIASDCLTQKDSSVFNDFKKTKGIRIYILHLSRDSILRKLAKESYATRIDAVLLKSFYDAELMDRKQLFQKIPKNEGQIFTQFFSKDKTFFTFGYDPYVVVNLHDSTAKIVNYNGLSQKTTWCSDLDSEEEWYPFYASLTSQTRGSNNFNWSEWMHAFLDNQNEMPSKYDTLFNCPNYFTLLSHLKNDNSAFKQLNKKEVVFPNQQLLGAYANRPAYGVVRQASNFHNAVLFLEYLQTDLGNKKINRALNTFPLESSLKSKYSYQQQSFEINYTPTPVLIEQFDKIPAILKAAKKIKRALPTDTLIEEL